MLAFVNLLIATGADINATDPGHGETALSRAVTPAGSHTLALVRLLLKKGADPNIWYGGFSMRGRQTPLHGAVWGIPEVVSLLLDHGADVDARWTKGPKWSQGPNRTALQEGVINGHKDIVEVLLRYKADPKIKDNEGKTALDYARDSGRKEILQLLQSR